MYEGDKREGKKNWQKDKDVNFIIVLAFSIPLCSNYSKGKAVPLQAWSGPEGSR